MTTPETLELLIDCLQDADWIPSDKPPKDILTDILGRYEIKTEPGGCPTIADIKKAMREVMSDRDHLATIYERFARADRALGGSEIALVLASDGCGRIETDEGHWMISWNSLAEGAEVIEGYCSALERGLSFEEYLTYVNPAGREHDH